MTSQRRNEVMNHIQELKSRLENWNSKPLIIDAIRDIGERAIRKELAKISRELKIDDVHHMKY